GMSAGRINLAGSNLTLVGANTDVLADPLNFATAIGAGATVGSSNTVVLGRSADTVQIPGALNVSGSFGANILNAATQFNLNGSRILGNAGTANLFAGVGAGGSNSTGVNNSSFGSAAGVFNTTGFNNSFFGSAARSQNPSAPGNAFSA